MAGNGLPLDVNILRKGLAFIEENLPEILTAGD
jgi:hypothetical protein